MHVDDDLTQFDYELPKKQIAVKPVQPRDASRLLVLHRSSGLWEHRTFRDLPQYLDDRDLIVANNTQVLKARLLGHRLREVQGQLVPGGKVEFMLLEEVKEELRKELQEEIKAQLRPHVWEGLFRASAPYRPGFCFEIPITSASQGSLPPLRGKLIRGPQDSTAGTVIAEFDRDPVESGAGQIPLPHYMGREACPADEEDYQTIYAKQLGSAAAPTAGLHFTESVLQEIRARGVKWEEITLHVGIGTFRPVKEQDISKHVMHEERYSIAPEVAERVTAWKTSGGRVLAVGTTTVRTLESAWRGESLRAGHGRTSLFIRPRGEASPAQDPRQFHVVNRLLTNFHLPKSTLLMLVCALAGRELTLAAYRDAVQQGYRFFSFGDAMLVLE